MKRIRYFFEAVFVAIFFLLFWILGPVKASNLGGWLGRKIGPKLAASRKAKRHLKSALPHLDDNRQNQVIAGMWENLGRVMAEYPHLEKISREYTTIAAVDRIVPLLNNNQPIVFIGAHQANWEVNGAAMYTQLDHKLALTYRPPNNPWTANILESARTLNGTLKAYSKLSNSGRNIIQTIRSGKPVGILIDQKYNEGLEADFFGMPAMTNPVFVSLAQKYRCPLIPVRCERLKGCEFRLTPYPEIRTFDDEGVALPTKDVISAAHDVLE